MVENTEHVYKQLQNFTQKAVEEAISSHSKFDLTCKISAPIIVIPHSNQQTLAILNCGMISFVSDMKDQLGDTYDRFKLTLENVFLFLANNQPDMLLLFKLNDSIYLQMEDNKPIYKYNVESFNKLDMID